ncbi:histidine kinase [Niveibacterium sp. 24ML]|uniref:sensor histidine kinase n=1 Tax=Niveibacterium sp. 24ML TaxID=2985512 RepID=UPI00226E5A44|nr:histidine kinase [Niveibacterium sp. 24ML]MCX9154800.1 histidine kinase [Niveibacterium sp. 24ML]
MITQSHAKTPRALTTVLLRELPLVLIFNTVFAALWTAISGSTFAEALLFSQCIGLMCFAVATPTNYIPTVAGKLAYGVVAAVLGVTGGLMLAATLAGYGPTAPFKMSPYGWRLSFGFSTLAFIATFGFFWWQEREQRHKADMAIRAAQAEAARNEAERAAASAQLAALQAQIEPHFLFNTLANLRGLITRDPELARQLLDRLIEWLRATLTASRTASTTLGAEVDLLAAYLEIQRIRMGGRLTVEIDIDPTLRSAMLPPLLMQPLVENAIAHGLEPKPGAVRIRLCAERSGEHLRLSVTDDGLGFGASSSSGAGMGLDNVHARLASHFGSAAHLSIESPPEGGVRAVIHIPLAALPGAPA